MRLSLQPVNCLRGSPQIPGDKSVSHRSLMLGALAIGLTEVSGLLESADVLSTWGCLKSLGVKIEAKGAKVFVHGVGMTGLKASKGDLDCGNSGTTLRLLMGILAGQAFTSRLIGDLSLSRRPMKRIAGPLEQMGARFELSEGNFAPLTLVGKSPLTAIDFDLPVASAQLKSALLLAGLFAKGRTRLGGLIQSRDHTERMLPYFGVEVKVSAKHIEIEGGQILRAAPVTVPGDPSTAAFWVAAASLIEGSHIQMENTLLNPSRIGFLNVLTRMGAEIKTEVTSQAPEIQGKIEVHSSSLIGTLVEAEEVPSLIDEIPLIAIVACFARGRTEVRGAEELRVKESDRIEAVAQNLRAMGAEIEVKPDGFIIEGPQKLTGALIDSMHDHRIAMAFSIAALKAQGETHIEHAECVAVSYPNFFETLKELSHG